MRFEIPMLFALAATTQLTTAAPAPAPVPEPAWNDKGPETGYKYGALFCSAGAYVCNRWGHTVGQDVLATAAFCCTGAAATVTASQSPGWVKAWEKSASALGTSAKVVGGGFAASGRFVAHCTVSVCKMVKAVATNRGTPSTRSIDGPKDENLVARLAQQETEFQEEDVLLSRYADSEPEADDDVDEDDLN